jgi:DNA-binding LytR/AlgR family response regulator
MIIGNHENSVVKEKLNNMLCLLNKQLGLFLSISFGLFLFVYIFKPFPLDHISFDNRKLFVFGLGIIALAVMLLVRIVFLGLKRNNTDNTKTTLSSYLNGFIIWLLSSIAFILCLSFVGSVHLSSYVVFNAVIICLFPPLILNFHDRIDELKRQIESLILESKIMQKKTEENEEGSSNPNIDLFSENRSEKFTLPVQDILFIRSADNYTEINYLNGGHRKKTLLRNTLRDIELQLKPYPYFIRCHRMCIINTNHIEKLAGNCNHHTLMMKGSDKEISVSRQHFLKIKEAI